MGNCNTGQTGGSCSSNESAAYITISNKKIIAQLDDLEVVLDDMKAALAELCDEEGANLQLISGILSEIIQENEECCALLLGKLRTLKTTIHDNVHICDEFTTTTTLADCYFDGEIACDGTAVVITIVAGDDISNVLDIYYYSGGLFVHLDSVSKAALVAGYTIPNPPVATVYRVVDNLSECNASKTLTLDGICTTSTTEEPGTTTTEEPGTTTTSTTEEPVTTTTTLCFDVLINVGEGYSLGYSEISAAWACASPLMTDLYGSTASFADTTYLNSSECGDVAPSGYYIIIGLGLWRYWNGVSFDASGWYSCPGEPT